MSPPTQAAPQPGEGRPEVGICDAGELVQFAKATLLQREQDALHDLQSLESRNERIESLLLQAMEMASEEPSPEHLQELERCVEVAQKARVLPQLRVQARKFLERIAETDKWAGYLEDVMKRLTKRLQELGDPEHRIAGSARGPAARQLKEDQTIKELRETISKSASMGVDEQIVEQAEAAIKLAERRRRARSHTATKLKGLLLVKDAETLGDRLQSLRRQDLADEGVQRLVSEIHGRVEKMAAQEQHQQWLDSELAEAAKSSDAGRLRQLQDQGRCLGLQVSPSSLALLHKLEASPQPPKGKEPAKKGERSVDSTSSAASRITEAEVAISEAEREPTGEKIAEARQALMGAERARLPEEAVTPLQRRLAGLEEQERQRFQAEQEIQLLLHAAGGKSRHRTGVLRDGRQVESLREALRRAEHLEGDADLLAAGSELLEKSLEVAEARRHAEDLLHNALLKPPRGEQDLERLQVAINEGRRCGIKTLHAEKEFARARDVQVHCEAAEAELDEACKGFGSQARARLDAAVQAARGAGISVEKLRAASKRLADLNKHEERCALAAGNLRRALPMLQTEPWCFQRAMEGLDSLRPWTAELQALVSEGERRLEKAMAAQCHLREAEQELQAMLRQIHDSRCGSHLSSGHMAELSRSLERARSAGVGQDLVSEAEKQLKSLKREGCQRVVAEHRLRLALSARDHDELERSVRQVRSLGRAGLLEAHSAPSGASSARGASGERERHDVARPEAPRSARLLEAAGTALKQLGEAELRRRAAAAALQELTAGASSSLAAGEWLRVAAEALREARQSGVAPALIEHARLRVRERKREQREEDQARAALQSSLSKKDAPTQEVLRNLRRVQRLQVAH